MELEYKIIARINKIIQCNTFFNPPPVLVFSGSGARRCTMSLFKEFKKHIEKKYDASFLVDSSKKNPEKLAEILYFERAEFLENRERHRKNIRFRGEDLSIYVNVFESSNFKKFFMRTIVQEILRILKNTLKENDIKGKIINRAFYLPYEVYAQKNAMLQNKSRRADLDLILTVIDISDEHEISQMYVTVKALQDKLDSQMYKKLRKLAKSKFGSCRIDARYFLYVLRKIEEFESKEYEKEENSISKTEISQKRENKRKFTKNPKSLEIQTSESDFKKYARGEKLEKETRYKLYLYRQKYREELENLHLERLSRDDALFFLINTEKLVENESLTLNQILRIIKYADSNLKIENPIGWLIARFMIGRGRFYFLLQKSKQNEKQEVTISKKYEYQEQGNTEPNKNKYVYINEELLYFAKKYNIPESDILSYLRKLKNLDGDVSYIVEIYMANRIWKNLSREERQELILYAKHQIKKFIVPPKPEEVKDTIKSIVFNEIKSRYLTLSIEEKIKMRNASQYYDTS
ncbi:MAG: hypothetical protein Q9M89_08170 [Persephonella sp.]|nr:hypothetical protein [Persephonella sp.]